jgi:hypothetical protein
MGMRARVWMGGAVGDAAYFTGAGLAQAVLCLDYGLDDRAIGAMDFSSSLCVQTGSGAHPASCPMGTGIPFSGGKKARPGHDADHSPPSSAEVENEELYLLSPQAPPWHVAGLICFCLLYNLKGKVLKEIVAYHAFCDFSCYVHFVSNIELKQVARMSA